MKSFKDLIGDPSILKSTELDEVVPLSYGTIVSEKAPQHRLSGLGLPKRAKDLHIEFLDDLNTVFKWNIASVSALGSDGVYSDEFICGPSVWYFKANKGGSPYIQTTKEYHSHYNQSTPSSRGIHSLRHSSLGYRIQLKITKSRNHLFISTLFRSMDLNLNPFMNSHTKMT